MSNKSRKSRERLRALKPDLVLPEERDPRQLWILVRAEPTDTTAGCFFVTHGSNFEKFQNLKGFEPMFHSYDRHALTALAREYTLKAGPNYQPKFSAHRNDPRFAEPAPEFSEAITNSGFLSPEHLQPSTETEQDD